jgi:acetylornithine deacetylase/succinyl-diaminopimelate desuccinylase-like protein
MIARCLPLVCFAIACAASPAPPPATPAAPSAPPPAAEPIALSPPPAAIPAVPPAPPPPPPTIEAEARELLDAMLRVDTSHGGETALLTPIAERLRQAGLSVELVESAPGRGNLIARVHGDGSKKPLLLLAHVDVVPIEGQPWTSPPFTPVEKDGFLIARGVGDDKGMAAAATAIVLELARSKTPLARDVILALTAGEETGGDAGARFLAAQHRELIDAELVLNEGGNLQLSPDLGSLEAVLVAVGEKTFQSYRLIAKAEGGHSSAPPPPDKDPVLHLSRALVAIAQHRFPARLLPEVRGMLGLQAKYEKPPLADAMTRIAKSGKLSHKDETILSADKIYNAFLRTTCVTTMLSAAPQDNVLPTSAEAVINCRVLPGETPETTFAALDALLHDPALTLAPDSDKGFASASPSEGEVLSAVQAVAAKRFPGVPVLPSITLGATDSRHLRVFGMLAYGVSVTPTSLDESRLGHGAHGPDERRPTAFLNPGIQFLRELTLALAR